MTAAVLGYGTTEVVLGEHGVLPRCSYRSAPPHRRGCRSGPCRCASLLLPLRHCPTVCKWNGHVVTSPTFGMMDPLQPQRPASDGVVSSMVSLIAFSSISWFLSWHAGTSASGPEPSQLHCFVILQRPCVLGHTGFSWPRLIHQSAARTRSMPLVALMQ